MIYIHLGPQPPNLWCHPWSDPIKFICWCGTNVTSSYLCHKIFVLPSVIKWPKWTLFKRCETSGFSFNYLRKTVWNQLKSILSISWDYFMLSLIYLLLFIGSKKSSISQVIITPCQAEPCQLKKGLNESLEVIFKPSKKLLIFAFFEKGKGCHLSLHGTLFGNLSNFVHLE